MFPIHIRALLKENFLSHPAFEPLLNNFAQDLWEEIYYVDEDADAYKEVQLETICRFLEKLFPFLEKDTEIAEKFSEAFEKDSSGWRCCGQARPKNEHCSTCQNWVCDCNSVYDSKTKSCNFCGKINSETKSWKN